MVFYVVKRPTTVFDNMGFHLAELLNSLVSIPLMGLQNIDYHRSDYPVKMVINSNKDRFHVNMDVKKFYFKEIAVKTVGRHVVVEAKHEEREDDRAFISRHYVRKYRLPEEYQPEDVVSSLSEDGILSITAPIHKPKTQGCERIVPITLLGPSNITTEKCSEPIIELTEED